MSATIRLAIGVAGAGLFLAACGGAGQPAPTPSLPTASAPSASPAAPTPAPSPSPSTPAPAPFAYQPLYPFASAAAARAWESAYAATDYQAWHLSAKLTALRFTQIYLGFTEIDRAAASSVAGGDAHVTVGLKLPNGTISHAAIIHLVKFSASQTAPWEVVGTDDTTLTLDIPAYGATVTSPVKVGGLVTGVDENLAVEVHRLGASTPVGSYCCQPAGGDASHWSFSVFFHATSGRSLTIVVHTGGHVAAVERFAVTGVRAG